MKIVLGSDGSIELTRGEHITRGQSNSRQVFVEWAEGVSPIDTGQFLADNMVVETCITRPDGEQSGWQTAVKVDSEIKYLYTLQAWDTAVSGQASLQVRWYDITQEESSRVIEVSNEAFFIVDNGKIAQPLNISSENYNEIVLQFITPLSAQAFRKYNVNALPDTIKYSVDGEKTAPALYFNFEHNVADIIRSKTSGELESVVSQKKGVLFVNIDEEMQTELFVSQDGNFYVRNFHIGDTPEMFRSLHTWFNTVFGETEGSSYEGHKGKKNADDINALKRMHLEGEGAPTKETIGKVGCFYTDITNGTTYICVDIKDNVCIWEQITSGLTTLKDGEGQYSVQTNDSENNHIKGKGSAGFGRYLGDEAPEGETNAYNLLSGYIVYIKGKGNSAHGKIGSIENPAKGDYNLAGGWGLWFDGEGNLLGGVGNTIIGDYNIIGGNNNYGEVTDGLVGGHHNDITKSKNIQILGNFGVVEKDCLNVSLIGERLFAKEGLKGVRILGEYNNPDTHFLNPLIVIGAGQSEASRFNAFEIQKGTGKAYFHNSVEVAVQGDSDNSVVIKKTVQKYRHILRITSEEHLFDGYIELICNKDTPFTLDSSEELKLAIKNTDYPFWISGGAIRQIPFSQGVAWVGRNSSYIYCICMNDYSGSMELVDYDINIVTFDSITDVVEENLI